MTSYSCFSTRATFTVNTEIFYQHSTQFQQGQSKFFVLFYSPTVRYTIQQSDSEEKPPTWHSPIYDPESSPTLLSHICNNQSLNSLIKMCCWFFCQNFQIRELIYDFSTSTLKLIQQHKNKPSSFLEELQYTKNKSFKHRGYLTCQNLHFTFFKKNSLFFV